jgi:nitrite reductase/ring-hydroxylating ferredoxin subunit
MTEIDLSRVLCRVADLADPGARAFTAGPGDWPLRGFVVRRGNAVQAYVNHCPHQGHPLNLRPDAFLTPDGALILCPSHGALFEITTGLCVGGPCIGRSLRRIPIVVEAGLVLLGDGAEALAEPDCEEQGGN